MWRYLLIIILLSSSGCVSTARFLQHGFPDQQDYVFQKADTIYPNDLKFSFNFTQGSHSDFVDSKKVNNRHQETLQTVLPKSNVVALMVIKNDSIIYEYYKPNYTINTTYTSFSLAKSFVATLIGIAIDEKKIKNIDESIINYIPELASKKGFEKLTFRCLLEHRSGLNYRDYALKKNAGLINLFYGKDITKVLSTLKIKQIPCTNYKYQNVNTLLLGIALERATKKRLPHYFQEKLWQKIGTQNTVMWSKDDNDNIKSYCCLQGKILDFAKFGRLYLNKGIYNAEQVVSKSWVDLATNPDRNNPNQYPLHFQCSGAWSPQTFNARGMYDQFILVNPKNKVIILQFCDQSLKPPLIFWRNIYESLSEELP